MPLGSQGQGILELSPNQGTYPWNVAKKVGGNGQILLLGDIFTTHLRRSSSPQRF